jgi:hypothetical protein
MSGNVRRAKEQSQLKAPEWDYNMGKRKCILTLLNCSNCSQLGGEYHYSCGALLYCLGQCGRLEFLNILRLFVLVIQHVTLPYCPQDSQFETFSRNVKSARTIFIILMPPSLPCHGVELQLV